jgi:hypothetical protein
MAPTMASATGVPRSTSATDAARDAVDLVKRRLFPFQFERWFALGFVAFLDQCGRGGGGPSFPSGGGSGGSPGGLGEGGEKPDLSAVGDWISGHVLIIVGITAAVLVLVVGLTALVLWVNSRGVFMYLDNVATGRSDVARPWREHKEKASSYFAWSFGASLAAMAGALVLLVPILWMAFLLLTGVTTAAVLGIVAAGLAFLLLVVAVGLFSVLLRDFAAPLQMHLGIPCGQALGTAWGLVKGNAGSFVAYVVLKIVFGIGAGIVAMLVGCCTCCLGFLPVVCQTILQPLLYFERAWSLCLLRQAGFDLLGGQPVPSGRPPVPGTALA